MKIVKILDKYTYVINDGTMGGIQKGQRCYIYIMGEEVIDPSTGESLGILEIPKVYCTVIHAQDKISTIQSDDAPTSYSNIPGLTIKFKQDYFEKNITETMKEIKLGDFVKVVLGS